MLNWLIGKHVRGEIKEHIHNLHLHLSNSFLNIKKDITNIHEHLNQKDKRILELEGKVSQLERRILYFLQFKEEEPKQIETSKEEVTEEKIIPISDLTSMTFTQQAILKAIYQLQNQLNSPISFKSLAKYLYPGKKYSAVRTTLSEYIDHLSTYNIVKKDRVGRETVASITKKGQKLAEEMTKKDKQKKIIENKE